MGSSTWPRAKKYRDDFYVQDLVPASTRGLRAIFVGESPHKDEVASDVARERTPFRGMAGRLWWEELGRYLKKPISFRPMPSREALEEVCQELRIVLMNAVQYPLDPKITLHFGEESAPRAQLGFEKASGPHGYKAVQKQVGDELNPVKKAIQDLTARFAKIPGAGKTVPVICLGNDSAWFVNQALAPLGGQSTVVPHPSAWWRNKDFRARAVAKLEELFARKVRKSLELGSS